MSNYNYVYYTAQINNDGSKSPTNYTNEEPNLEFKEDRKVPIIQNTEEYMMAVESAMFDLKTLPVFIPTIKYNNDSPTNIQRLETIYEVTLEFDGMAATVPVYFTPQDETLFDTPPSFINGVANYKTGYYNLYNYEFFFTAVNEAIRNAMILLIPTIRSYNGTLPTAFSNLATSGHYEIPYFIFDKESSLIFLNSPKKTFDSTNTAFISIYLNKPLYRLFNSLPFILQNKTLNILDSTSTQTTTTKTLFKLNLSNFKQANEVEIFAHLSNDTSATIKSTHLLIYQDYETLSSWSPVESIVLISPNFPVPSHQMSASLEYLDGMINQLGNERTEQEILEVENHTPVPYVLYEPKQFRWMHLKQSDSDNMRQILFKVFYRYKLNGDLIPVKAGIGGSFSVKLMFKKIK
jgi:hypothetical protein